MAQIYLNLRQFPQSLTLLQQARQEIRTHSGAYPFEEALVLNALGEYHYYKDEDLKKAEHYLLQANQKLDSIREPMTEEGMEISGNMAIILADLGRPRVATNMLRERLGQFEARHPGADETTAKQLGNLGSILAESLEGEDLAEAEKLLLQSLEMKNRLFRSPSKTVSNAQHNLASLYWQTERYAKAEDLAKRALATRSALLGDTHIISLSTTNLLVGIFFAQGKLDEALALSQSAVQSLTKAYGKDHRRQFPLLGWLGQIHYRLGELELCVTYSRERIRISQLNWEPGYTNTAMSQILLGKCLQELDRLEEARFELQESCRILNHNLGKDTQWARIACNALDEVPSPK